MTVSGAPLHKSGGALRQRMHRGEPHAVGVEGNLVQLGKAVTAGNASCAISTSAISMGSPKSTRFPCCSPALRSWHRKAVRKNGR